MGVTQNSINLKKKVNIELIAKEAGVSKATVSRVLNGSAKVSPEFTKAVNKAVKKFGFVPDAAARQLAGGRSGLTVLLLEETNEEFFLNPFWGQVVQGFSSTISKAGLHPILLIHPKTADEESLFRSLQSNKVDGIAIFSWHRPIKNYEKMLDPRVSVVLGGDLGGSEKYPFVDVDNVKGGFLAANHLIEQGCKRILTITGDMRLQSARDRLAGYENALTKSGLDIDTNLIVNGDYTQSKSEDLLRKILDGKTKFDGLFAANDQSAIGAINVLSQKNISIPSKVKVVGFDDSPIASKTIPSLTSIKQPIRELGSEVAHSLINLIQGKEVPNKLIDVKLIKRASTSK